jgi:hypothetical protein
MQSTFYSMFRGFYEVRSDNRKMQTESDWIMGLMIYTEPHITHLEYVYIDTALDCSSASGM